jgi:hypothetical protein
VSCSETIVIWPPGPKARLEPASTKGDRLKPGRELALIFQREVKKTDDRRQQLKTNDLEKLDLRESEMERKVECGMMMMIDKGTKYLEVPIGCEKILSVSRLVLSYAPKLLD